MQGFVEEKSVEATTEGLREKIYHFLNLLPAIPQLPESTKTKEDGGKEQSVVQQPAPLFESPLAFWINIVLIFLTALTHLQVCYDYLAFSP